MLSRDIWFFFSDIRSITTMANIFKKKQSESEREAEREEMAESKIETMTINIYGERRRTELYRHIHAPYILLVDWPLSWLMGSVFLQCIRRFGFEYFTFIVKEMFWRWYFKSYSLANCVKARSEKEWTSVTCHIFALASIHNQQRKLSEYTSFIYLFSFSGHHTCSFIHSLVLSILVLILLMIRFHRDCYYYYLFLHYHLLFGEPESTMIYEVARAVCKLCMFEMLQR